MDNLIRDGSPLTDNEQKMVFNIHQHFLKVWQCQKQYYNLSLRKEVAVVFGIKEAIVVQVVAEQNKKNNGEF